MPLFIGGRALVRETETPQARSQCLATLRLAFAVRQQPDLGPAYQPAGSRSIFQELLHLVLHSIDEISEACATRLA